MGTKASKNTNRANNDADASSAEGLNQATIVGELVREPTTRVLKSGMAAVSFSLTVRLPGRASTSVPVVWYDPPARIERWQVGDIIVVLGSVTRRFFRSGGSLASATEVVVERGERAAHRAKAKALLQRADRAIGAFAEELG